MQFSVIYSVDIPAPKLNPGHPGLRPWVPPRAKELWDETEDDSGYEFSYLEGRWSKGHHRKWCALLSREEFDDFVQSTGLSAQACETGGSLGAPGYGFGWAPAIAFALDSEDAIGSAYVTPSAKDRGEVVAFLVDTGVDVPADDGELWAAVKAAVLKLYT